MASPADIIAQTSSINLISKSISATRSSVSSSSGTISTLQKIISRKTRIRNELFFKNKTLISRRKEASRRRELEDQIEASKVTTSIQSGLKVVSASSQGPLGRILSFLGYMGAGWIIENIPTWIAVGKEFIARMKKAGDIIYSIPNTMLQTIRGFGIVLESTGRNILSLDFTDSSGRIKNSFAELNDTIELLGTQISDGFKLMLQPSGEVDIPSTGEQQPDTEFPDIPPVPSPSGSGGSGGGKYKPLLDLISSGESSGGGYSAMYPSENHPQILNMSIAEVIQFQKQKQKDGRISAAIGRYQMLYPEIFAKAAGIPLTAKFSPENQDKMVIAYLKKERKLGEWEQGKISDESFSEELAQEFGAFKSATGYVLPGNTGSIDFNKLKPVLKQIKSGSSQKPAPPTQSPTAPPITVSTGKIKLIPQTGSGGFIQGGSGSGKETTYATHFHLDAKNKNPSAEQLANIREVAFQATKVMIGRESTVYFGNIQQYASKNDSILKNQIAAEQKAHGARSSMAVDMQESNPKIKQTFPSQAGSATKFPFAVGEVYYRGGYGREAEIIGSSGLTVSHGAEGSKSSGGISASRGAEGSKSSGVSLKPSLISPQNSKVPKEQQLQPTKISEKQPEIYSLSPEQRTKVSEAVEAPRKRQEILFIDDRSLTQQSASSSVFRSSYGGGSSGQITEFDMLNKFMKQKLLLDFNYL